MSKTNYNSMYRSNFKKEEPKAIFEEENAPVEESAVEEAPFEEAEVEEVEEVIEEEAVEEIEEVIEEEEIVETPIEEPIKATISKTGTVTGGLSLNVRRTPGGEIIKVLHNGENVTIVDDSDDEWYKISDPYEGFVMKKFISKN